MMFAIRKMASELVLARYTTNVRMPMTEPSVKRSSREVTFLATVMSLPRLLKNTEVNHSSGLCADA